MCSALTLLRITFILALIGTATEWSLNHPLKYPVSPNRPCDRTEFLLARLVRESVGCQSGLSFCSDQDCVSLWLGRAERAKYWIECSKSIFLTCSAADSGLFLGVLRVLQCHEADRFLCDMFGTDFELFDKLPRCAGIAEPIADTDGPGNHRHAVELLT